MGWVSEPTKAKVTSADEKKQVTISAYINPQPDTKVFPGGVSFIFGQVSNLCELSVLLQNFTCGLKINLGQALCKARIFGLFIGSLLFPGKSHQASHTNPFTSF